MTTTDRDLRPLRRPLRPRDADPGARRADGGLGRGARRPGLSRRGRAPRPHLHGAAVADHPRRRASRRTSGSTSSARISTTRARTRSTTRSGRSCSRGGSARRGSSPRRAPGQHGVATATACARFGLECVVFMGSEDMRRQAPNVERMHLMGATVVPVEFGTRTLKEATSEAIRDWITNVETTHYVIGSCVGPGPVPGDRARAAGRDRPRGARAAARGRGRAAGGGRRLRRRRLERDRHVRRLHRRPGRAAGRRRGRGRRVARRRAHRRAARLALVDPRRRRRPDRRRALDLGRARLPRRRPGARLPARHRPRRVPPVHRRRGARRVPAALAHGGDHPGARVVARARASSTRSTPSTSLVCLSGRGDKDLAEALAALGLTREPGRPAEADAAPAATGFSLSSGRKTLVIYLMAGAETPALAEAAVAGGADIVELGFPFSDPLADGPVIRAAAEKALAAGMRTRRLPRVPRRDPRARRRHAADPDDLRLAARGVRLGALRGRRPRRRRDELHRRRHCRRVTARAAARPARRPHLDRRAHRARRRRDRRLALPRHAHRHDRRAHGALRRARRARRPHARRSRTSRSTPASASRRPSRRAPRPISRTASSSARAPCRWPRKARRRSAPTSPRCGPRSTPEQRVCPEQPLVEPDSRSAIIAL